ncbi:uncharacterized protein B0P05DRAFT_541300 [Gilbertella persicaria]|uniref:uncharacterized protein n=1 Tax=Gilbertella persicaria TaxID=101096 RepID=UPI00221F72CC|nr:uncharacterized protein B0P05DRAFT_541300 [Gilbertella persicaria]KAI8079602.1 hypothetical protein B0P05DRAFT_541300 [Gilbertella persicaria]
MSSAFIHTNSHNLLHTSNTINEEEEEQEFQQAGNGLANDLRNCSISSTGSIDIHGQPVNSNILVALLDRPGEMKGLALHNSQFYEALEHYITETQGSQTWQKFQDIVYKPREKMSDRVWMHQISQYLAYNPVFLTKFKEIVGYEEHEDYPSPPSSYTLPPHRPSTSKSTGSISSGSGRRRSRRLSNISLSDALDEDDMILEEAPRVPEGMFTNEDQFYHQQQQPNDGRRRRASYHSIQSEPHPTFVDKFDEVNFEVAQEDESDHLADLLDDDDDDDEQDQDDDKNDTNDVRNRAKDIGAGYSTPTGKGRQFNDMDLLKLRDHPDIQANLPQTHPQFFLKAKQLLSIAPSSRRFSDTIRRNSILEDAMPESPVTELEELRFQTCMEDDEKEETNLLEHVICSTRRQQPDDGAWLSGVLEALSGWPELIERLHEIIQASC